MKREGMLVLIFILAINFCSAAYVCSLGSSLIDDKKEIDVGEEKTVNGIYVGVAKSHESLAVGRYESEILIEFESATLTDEAPTQQIEFSDENVYNVTLVNLTADESTIKIGSSSGKLFQSDWAKISGLEVFLPYSNGEYPGDAEVRVFVGKKRVTLSSYEDLDQIITFSNVDYLIELFTASDEGAIVKVYKCDNSSAKISEVADEVETPELNDSLDEEINESENETDVNNTEINLNATESTNDSTNQTNDDNSDRGSDLIGFISFYGLIISGVVFLFLLFRHWKNRKVEESISQVS